MSKDFTSQAAAGFRWQRAGRPADGLHEDQAAFEACPYPNTSDEGKAWHLGRHLAKGGFARPGEGSFEVRAGRRNEFHYGRGGRVDPRTHTTFRWDGDVGFEEVA